jgi:hypothetical protein
MKETSMDSIESTGYDCAGGNCVAIAPNSIGGFTATSTLGEDKGRTFYTAAEIASFLTDVKAGKWDAVLAHAESLAATELASA